MNQVIGSNFLQLARHVSAKAKASTETKPDDYADYPNELNPINSSGGFLFVAPDKLSVKYTGVSHHGHDVGVVQANKPVPEHQPVYYFEIFVKDAGAKGQIAIGFTNERFNMRRQPGWEADSYGYHGDDGILYHGQGKKFEFGGPTYTTGDTVGAGVNCIADVFFFTKNGQILVLFDKRKELKCPLFPTIAVHSQNEEVHVNFGGENAFVFYLEQYRANEMWRWQKTIEKILLPPNISHGLVRSYLLHYGYEDTLTSFDSATQNAIPPINLAQENRFDEQDITYELNRRKILRQLIRNGEIDAAISRIREWYPQILQDDRSAIWFLLHCQKFIELIRVEDLEAAVTYGRTEFGKFTSLPEFDDLLQECATLLAYERPQESSVRFLLDVSRRDLVADMVNAMILSTNPNIKDMQGCSRSYLERLLMQRFACCFGSWSVYGNKGELIKINGVGGFLYVGPDI